MQEDQHPLQQHAGKLCPLSTNLATQKINPPTVPLLQLGLIKNQQCTSEDSEDSEIVDEEDPFQAIVSTWRSIGSTLQSLRGDTKEELNTQLQALHTQVFQMMEAQRDQQLSRFQDESEAQKKVNDLINNLEAKHLKISEQNRKLLQGTLLGGSTTLTRTQDFFPNATTATVAFLDTLNQIVQEEDDEQSVLQQQIESQATQIAELQDDNDQLAAQKETIQRNFQTNVETLQNELSQLERENSRLQHQLKKSQSLRLSFDNKENLNSANSQKQASQVDALTAFFASEMSIEKIRNQEIQTEKLGQVLETKLLQSIQLLVCDIQKALPYQNGEGGARVIRQTSVDLFKRHARRNSYSDQAQQHGYPLEEPTPRFILDSHKKQKQFSNDLGITMFPANLDMNRSLYQQKSGTQQLNSTLNNVLKNRPQLDCSADSQPSDQLKALWAYIFELEQQLLDQQQKFQRQRDESELDASVCMGANDAVKHIKTQLEAQIEVLNADNQQKTQRILKLEQYNGRLQKTVSEAEGQDQSFMQNLRGILSPSHYKKISKFVQNDCQTTDGNADQSQLLGCTLSKKQDQSTLEVELFQPDISGINDSFELALAPTQNNNVFLENSIVNNEQINTFEETRIKSKDSRNSTMSFRLNIDTQEDQQVVPNQLSLISPINPNTSFHRFNKRQAPFSQKNNCMLIQDQKDASYYDAPQTVETDEQMFLNQPSDITYAGVEQTQFLNTQNNRTLQNLFKFNNSRRGGANQNTSAQGSTQQQPLFNFKRRPRQNLDNNMSVNQSRSFIGGQSGNQMIQQMHENFQTQLQGMKDEKLKLIHILNKFLQLPEEASVSSIEEKLNSSKEQSSLCIMPTKQDFEEFRVHITQALSKREQELQEVTQQKDKLTNDKEAFTQEKERLEKKRQQFNNKVEKLKSKNEEINKKIQLLEEREKLLEQQEQKLKYRKQAMDEQWKQSDKRKLDLGRQEEVIQREWDNLKKELGELTDMRKAQKESKFQIKEEKAKNKEERSLLEQKEDALNLQQSSIDKQRLEIDRRQKQLKRDQERIERLQLDLKDGQEEIEKQKLFISGERQLLEEERQGAESKRNLSGMFIPDIKKLVSKMHKHKTKSVNGGKMSRQSHDEDRVKQTDVSTNMSAYLKKQSADHCNHDSSFSCELHKSINNKSSLSIKNLCSYHQQNQTFSIGSGRPTYKLSEKPSLSKIFHRNNQQTRQPTTKANQSYTFKLPPNAQNESSIEDQENDQKRANGLQSILRDTAKFKQSRNKLEHSFNSLIEGNNNQLSQCSFMSNIDDKVGANQEKNGHSFSREELL